MDSVPAGGQRGARYPHSLPGLEWEPGAEPPPCLLTRALALTAGLGVERGPRVGGAPHPGMPRLRASRRRGRRGCALRGLPCGREPGCSRVFRGTQLQTRTPREGRGQSRGGAAGAGRLTRGLGRRDRARRVTVPGCPGPGRQTVTRTPACGARPPLLSRSSPVRSPTSASPHHPRRGQGPFPSAWLRSP